VVPARFFPLAVGVSLLTALAAPVLTSHSMILIVLVHVFHFL
jgi:hypothetical protein